MAFFLRVILVEDFTRVLLLHQNMSSHQSNKDKPRAAKCNHFCHPFDHHNYCPTCREAGKGDDPCVTLLSPCTICSSFTEEQLAKITHRKRYSKKSDKNKAEDIDSELLGDNSSEAHGPLQRAQTPPIPGRLADQVSIPGGSPSEHSGSGRSNPVLGMDHQSTKIRTESHSGVFVRGLRVPPRFSPCKTHSREMAQTSGFYPTTQVKTCFDCKMFDVSNWVASLNGENGPRGTTSHEALSVSPQGALEISSTTGQPPSLDRSHLCTPRLVAEPCKRDERLRPSSQRPQYPTLYRRLKRRLGRSLRTKFYPRSVVSPGKRPSHKCPRIESYLSGPETLQRPVSGPNSASCDGQLNCGCLHKQTRGNTLSGDVCTPVENHDLVPSFSHHIESQAHCRVPECDGRPTFQVESGTVDRMVTTSTGAQTDLPKVVHSPRGPICHSSEPQASTVRVPYPRPKGLGHRCSKHRLDGSHCLCLPSNGSPSQGDPKNRAMQLSDHSNSPRLARDSLILGPSAALNRDPTTTPGVDNTPQTIPQLRVPQEPAAPQPPRLVARSGQL